MAEHGALGKKQCIILHALCYLTQTQLHTILRIADTSLIRSICECALNVLRGNVKLNDRQRKRLRRHATLLRRLAEKKGSWVGKRRLIAKKQNSLTFFKNLLIPVLRYINHGAC